MKNIIMITAAVTVLSLTGCDRELEEACPDGQVMIGADTGDTAECGDPVAEE